MSSVKYFYIQSLYAKYPMYIWWFVACRGIIISFQYSSVADRARASLRDYSLLPFDCLQRILPKLQYDEPRPTDCKTLLSWFQSGILWPLSTMSFENDQRKVVKCQRLMENSSAAPPQCPLLSTFGTRPSRGFNQHSCFWPDRNWSAPHPSGLTHF